MAPHRSSPGLLLEGLLFAASWKAIWFFLARWFLMGAAGEEGKKQNRLQHWVEESWRVEEGQAMRKRETPQDLLQSIQSHQPRRMDTPKPYKTPPPRPMDIEKREGEETWLYGRVGSRAALLAHTSSGKTCKQPLHPKHPPLPVAV